MSWKDLLQSVATKCNTLPELLNISSMRWKPSRPANAAMMPLATESAFGYLIHSINAKTPQIQIWMGPPAAQQVPVPAADPIGGAPSQMTWYSLDKNNAPEDDDHKGATSKVQYQAILEQIVQEIEAKYPIGLCKLHETERCFHYRPADTHYKLDRTRMLVWASSIERKETNIDRLPLNSNLFKAKDAILKTRPSTAPTTSSDNNISSPVMQNGSPHIQGSSHQFPNWPPPPGYPPPWGYSSVGYGGYYPSPSPFYHQMPPAEPRLAAQPRPSSPAPPGDLDAYMEWCKHTFSTRMKLEELGFSLSSVPETEWKAVGFKFFEWQLVLKRDREYRKYVKENP
ncbi:hypothetical protein M422DRAFT_242071 [Sphaerobolus stellatus SS14]|nr:hypothetical protein M422DRAFT_242071 [Sphaerobolus stellatus SS14]